MKKFFAAPITLSLNVGKVVQKPVAIAFTKTDNIKKNF